MPESVGAVSLELQADASGLLNHIKSIAGQISDILGNSVSKSFSVTNTNNVDLSGVTSILNTISGKIDGFVSSGMTKGATEGAEAVKTAVTNAVSDVKMPTIKVAMSKEDLAKQLENMLSLLDNTNAKIAMAESALANLRKEQAGLTAPDASAFPDLNKYLAAVEAFEKSGAKVGSGLSAEALQKKILDAEAALLKLTSTSNQLVTKTNAVEAAINNFGAEGKKDVQKVAESATMAEKKIDAVGTAAIQTTQKVDKVGDAGQSAGKKASSGISKIVRELTSAGKSAGASGLEQRLSKIEHATQKTMRSVTALGRRFFVLFTGKMISAAFAGVSDSLVDASKSSDQLNKSMGTLTGAGKTVSNGVITAIAPLINVVAPILGNIAEKIRVFSNQVAMFIATILGQDTVMQAGAVSAEGYGEAVTGAADAAAKANKTLAGFDTLNILSSNKDGSGGSGGSGGGSGSSAPVFEEVPLKNNKWAESLKSQIGPLKEAFEDAEPSLKAFYTNVMVPFGSWVMGEGIPDLVTFFGDVAQFFADHPDTIDDVALLAANLALLSPLGAKGIAIAVTVSLGVGAAELLTGKDFAASIAAIFDAWRKPENYPTMDIGTFVNWAFDPKNISDAFSGSASIKFFADLATFMIEGLTGIDLGFGVDQFWKSFELKMKAGFVLFNANVKLWFTENITNAFINEFNKTLDNFSILGIDLSAWKIPPIDTTELETSAQKAQQAYNTVEEALRTANDKTTQFKDNTTTSAASVIQTYGGMPADVAQKLEAYKAVVAQKSLDTGNIMSYTAGVYKGHTVGVYDALSAETRAKMGLYSNYAKVGGQDAGNYLADGTKVGTANAQEFVRKYVNNTATYLAANANNTIDSVASQQSTFAGIPFAIQQKLGLVWGAWNKPAKISFPAFANGAFLRANQPQLAIVGDNRTEGEFVAPESKLQEAVMIGISKAMDMFSPRQSAAVADGGITIIIGDQQITDYITTRNNRRKRMSNG